jgi:hypothetical protein
MRGCRGLSIRRRPVGRNDISSYITEQSWFVDGASHVWNRKWDCVKTHALGVLLVRLSNTLSGESGDGCASMQRAQAWSGVNALADAMRLYAQSDNQVRHTSELCDSLPEVWIERPVRIREW